jgi:hypothetical protein
MDVDLSLKGVAYVKKIMAILLLLLCMNSTAWANLSDLVSSFGQSPVSVVVFMDKQIIADGKAVTQMRGVLKEKFKYASNIAIYGDDQAKSPEFLEFVDKIKTDPANEKEINVINIGELANYGRAIKSDHIILITVSRCNTYWNFWSGIRVDTKENISVIDVKTQKYLVCVNYFKEGNDYFSSEGAQFLVNKLATDFKWLPPVDNLSDNKTNNQLENKKPAVVVFLPDVVLEKPDLVEKVRKVVSAKFGEKDVPIYIDDKQKSPEFLDLIARVGSDSAKQQTLIVKKESLAEYGKTVNANLVTAIIISNVGPGDEDFNYRLKEDIFVVDTENNKYVSNVVFDTVDKKKRQEGIDFLMNKLQLEFKSP